MQITKAEFKCSSERISQVPKDGLKDIAFIGRSNVGKSSLINMLTARGGLAKVSGTPGKTRLVNHFRINDAWYLVDLPGYGYARTSKTQRGEFSKLITDYVLKCEKMHFLFVLADIRLEPQKIDHSVRHHLHQGRQTLEDPAAEERGAVPHGARRTMGGAAADVRLLVGERHRTRRDPRLHRRMPASELTPEAPETEAKRPAAGAKTAPFRKCLTDC